MKLLRKILILTHRYLGLAFALLIVVWFASGIVMMYAGGMPRLSAELRRERLPDLDLARVRLSPAEASDRAAIADGSGAGGTSAGTAPRRPRAERVQLLTVMERPAYRVGNATVFADTGNPLPTIGVDEARTIAARFVRLPEARVQFAGTLTRVDQWTLGQSRALPLHKFSVDDDEGTQVYVQPEIGEVTTLTTRRGRLLAWIGTIPHWLYFTALRDHQPLWYQLVVWTSAAACVVSLLGLVLGVTQLRKARPFRLSRSIPYAGWMRWHYVTGVLFGVFTLTWAFSGLLSMEPFAWTNAEGLEVPRTVFTGGAVDLERFATPDATTWNRVLDGRAIKEMEFVRIQDEPYYLVRQAADAASVAKQRERLHQPYNVTGRTDADRVLVAADTLQVRREPFSTASLLARLRAAVPDTPVVDAVVLDDYDSYYYSRGRQTPLPVLRVRFADPAETWFYVDPETSQMLGQIHRLNRVERWLYNGLHSLDFRFWYDRRPLWDIGMLTLLLGGLISTSIGFSLGIKRLWKAAASARQKTFRIPDPKPQIPTTRSQDRGQRPVRGKLV